MSEWTPKETEFLRNFHAALDSTTTPVPLESVRIYWRLTQAHLDPDWRLPLPSDATLTKIAHQVSVTRRLDAFYQTPDELAWHRVSGVFSR